MRDAFAAARRTRVARNGGETNGTQQDQPALETPETPEVPDPVLLRPTGPGGEREKIILKPGTPLEHAQAFVRLKKMVQIKEQRKRRNRHQP